jgi:hypothetical protein
MKTLLSKVEDVFEIEGRGCVITPARSSLTPKDAMIRRADPIELRKPDGSVVQTHIFDVEMIDYADRTKSSVALVLPREFSKADFPVGTEIWLNRA